MDNLTHTLLALTLARTRLGRTGQGHDGCPLPRSNAPDIDIVATAGGGLNYLRWHRGPTHGPLGVVELGLVTAERLECSGRCRTVEARSAADATADASFVPARCSPRCVCSPSSASTGHVLMDLPTSYGTRLAAPSWPWFAIDWMPIVDVYLFMTLAPGCLVFGRMYPDEAAQRAVDRAHPHAAELRRASGRPP